MLEYGSPPLVRQEFPAKPKRDREQHPPEERAKDTDDHDGPEGGPQYGFHGESIPMTDPHLIPLSDSVKAKGDVAAGLGAIASLFKLIPWPEIAAFLAAVYTALRIIEWVVGKIRKK